MRRDLETRRSVLALSGTAMTALAGCSGSNSSESGDEESLGLELYYPEPRAVSTDQNNRDFTVEIQNTGDSGDIAVTFVWLEEANQDIWGAGTEMVQTKERYYNSDERREITFTHDVPDRYEGFGFRLWPPQLRTEIYNPGREARIETLLLNSNEVIKEAELEIDSDETVEHVFEYDFSQEEPRDIRVEAEVVD
jgi:hypothetical protein